MTSHFIQRWPFRLFIAPDLDKIQTVVNAFEFKRKIGETCINGEHFDAECDWVFQYAKEEFDRAMKVYKELDDKADGIIKYLGGGTGIFTLGILANVTKVNVAIVEWAVPAFVMALMSILFAILARKPSGAFLPPSIDVPIRYVNALKSQGKAQALFVGEFFIATEGMHAACDIKCERVAASMWMFYATIISLILPVGGAIRMFGFQ